MVREIGDLWPQGSGTSSLGVEQFGSHGFGTTIRPFAHMHMNSGVFHNPSRGSSGIIRFQNSAEATTIPQGDYFGFSFDGGKAYPCEIGINQTSNGIGTDFISPFGATRVLASGDLSLLSFEGDIAIVAFSNDSALHGITIATVNGDILLSATNGGLSLNCDNDFSATSNANMFLSANNVVANASVDAAIAAIRNVTLTASNNIMLAAGSFDNGGQINLSPFQASGVFEYRFGPHQSWYIKTSHSSIGGPFNDGYWPIAHSGNVKQLIAQAIGGSNSGLQFEYNAGRTIYVASNPGNLEITSNTAKTSFSTLGTQAELNLSGLFTPPTLANLGIGDLFMMNHSVISGIVGTTDLATSQAKALGPAGPVVQTGSGIINLMTGSGIAQWITVSVMNITKVAQVISFNTPYQASDTNYATGSEAAGTSGLITIFSPGLYQANCKVQVTKTVGTNPQSCRIRARLNGAALLGGAFNTFHFDITNAATQSASLTNIFNADAGDILSYDILSTLDGADNCQLATRAGVLVVQKIGPKRWIF